VAGKSGESLQVNRRVEVPKHQANSIHPRNFPSEFQLKLVLSMCTDPTKCAV